MTTSSTTTHTDLAIIGTGFAGLGMAIKLKETGREDFLILERAADVGGTWRDNTYPGCQCDIPSNLYSFSFRQNPDWTRTYPLQSEIWDYLRAVAQEHDLVPKIRFDHQVLGMAWDEDAGFWRLDTTQGEVTANVVVSGVGGLSDPQVPELPGLSEFEGEIFHSARWDHDADLRGKRVAVVGTGASAIQFVPEIQPEVAQMHVFQRTPPWVTPSTDRAVTRLEKWLFKRFPAIQRLRRNSLYWAHELYTPGVVGLTLDQRFLRVADFAARMHLKRQVKDPDLRAKLTPDYTIGCKRILKSNDWYPAIQKENVEVLHSGVTEVRGNKVVDSDGEEREVDAIIFGTGFHVEDMPVASYVRTRDGQTLEDKWEGSPRAYLGIAISDCPNFFMLTGPNSGQGHTSMVFMIESQIEQIKLALDARDANGGGTIEVHPGAEKAWNDKLQKRTESTVWVQGGCSSWYLDRNGKNSILYPDWTWRFRMRCNRFVANHWITRPGKQAPAKPEPVKTAA